MHRLKKDIESVNFNHLPILKLARMFFKAVRIYDALPEKDVDLWVFLYSERVRNRMQDAFSRKNIIDGETMQRELNSNRNFASDYYFFNKVYQKQAHIPKEWLISGSKEHAKLLKHFKQERNNGLRSST